ncbi:MAG TPA: hypothetical protein VFF60_00145 [Candidatus Binatus sp.]|nr:hypothetical protein [Candidatus Binatus sp.]
MDATPPPEPKKTSEDRVNLWIIGCLGVGLIGTIVLVAVLFISAVSKFPTRTLPAPETTAPPQAPLGIPVPPGRFTPASGQSVFLDLDTQSGHNSSWRKDNITPYSAVYGRLTVVRLGSDQLWQPAFWIGLQGQAGESFRDGIGLRLTPVRGGSALALEVTRVDGGKVTERRSFSAHLSVNEQMGITIDWATPHAVTFTLSDGEVQTVSVPWRIVGAAVYSSTGEIVADPLELGSMSPSAARSGHSSL